MLQTSDSSDIMLVELQHRTANTFQLLTGLLRYRLKGITTEETRDELLWVLDAITSLGLLQQRIGQARGADLAGYIADVMPFWDRLGSCRGISVRLGRLDELFVADRVATNLALIVHELITNCFEHAFSDSSAGAVVVEVHKVDGRDEGELWVRDDGCGVSDPPQDDRRPDELSLREHSLGLPLIRKLVQAIGGRLEISRNGGGGQPL